MKWYFVVCPQCLLKGGGPLVTCASRVESLMQLARRLKRARIIELLKRNRIKKPRCYRHPGGMSFSWGCEVTIERDKGVKNKKRPKDRYGGLPTTPRNDFADARIQPRGATPISPATA